MATRFTKVKSRLNLHGPWIGPKSAGRFSAHVDKAQAASALVFMVKEGIWHFANINPLGDTLYIYMGVLVGNMP